MKLLYIANLRLPTEKAYGIQIAKMCEAFSLSSKVELVVPHRKNKIKDDLFDYYSVKRNFRFKTIWAPDFYLPGKLDKVAVNVKNFISALLLCFYALMHRSDIIYTRDEWSAYFLSFFKKNIIFEAHRFSSNRKPFYQRFKHANLKIVVISNGLKGDFVLFGFQENNLLVAPDGVDLAEFDITISKEEAREKIGLPQNKKIIMYAGHLFEWKGAALLLEVAKNFKFKIFNFKTPDILFVFVGGTEHDIKEFKKKAEGLDNVLILGHKPHSQVPVYLKAADILVLPNSSKEEISSKYTSPLKLFEYMASGRPMVASSLESIREILKDKDAYFFQPESADSLVKSISLILGNEPEANQKAVESLKLVKEFSWQKRAQKILDFSGFNVIVV